MPQKLFFVLMLFSVFQPLQAQNPAAQLEAAIKQLEGDAQFASSILSMYVVNSKTNQVVYKKNEQTGMAPASCQKVVTAAAAFELLKKDFRFKTTLGYNGNIRGGVLDGNLIITGSGDPTLGSWRYSGTKEDIIKEKWLNALKDVNIKSVNGFVLTNQSVFNSATIPDGWIWQDIGNYYGAGAWGLNWRENQFDLTLKSGSHIGDAIILTAIAPPDMDIVWTNELRAAAKGSGDNAYIYTAPYTGTGFLRGTIPVDQNSFVISGSIPNPPLFTAQTLTRCFRKGGVPVEGKTKFPDMDIPPKIISTHLSPALDSITYWFLKKSVNLYGEALLKTMAVQQKTTGSTDSGVTVARNFWAKNGIKKNELKIMDGSGLSPQNRVTTQALVKIMQYARSRNWFADFFNALPEINGIKMKDGYISGVRSYTGYIKSRSGEEYTFSLIVNNFDGSPSTVREKMWKVLDILK